MFFSTFLIYACGMLLGFTLASIMVSFSMSTGRFSVKAICIIGFSALFSFFMGAPFFFNTVMQPSNMGIAFLLRDRCPDATAASVMLFCALAYHITLAIAVRKDALFPKLKTTFLVQILLFGVWSLSSLFLV